MTIIKKPKEETMPTITSLNQYKVSWAFHRNDSDCFTFSSNVMFISW